MTWQLWSADFLQNSGCVLKVFRVSEERRFEVEKKSEPTQSQAADRFEQRIRQHRQQHKEEMEVSSFVASYMGIHLNK